MLDQSNAVAAFAVLTEMEEYLVSKSCGGSKKKNSSSILISTGFVLFEVVALLVQILVVVYQMLRIILLLLLFALIQVFYSVFITTLYNRVISPIIWSRRSTPYETLLEQLGQATSWVEWQEIASTLQEEQHWQTILDRNDSHFDALQLVKNVKDLISALHKKDFRALQYILQAFVKRNHLGIDAPELHLACPIPGDGAKDIIELYTEKVIEALEMLSDKSTFTEEFPVKDRVAFFKKLKKSYGSTALCLSGGGVLSMYHVGVIEALLEADSLPNIMSGSSGGSIIAAFCAMKTNQEILDDVANDKLGTLFNEPEVYRWCPPLKEQLFSIFTKGFLINNEMYIRTAKRYYSEPYMEEEKFFYYTFQDAFEKSGRHVSITVTANGSTKGHSKMLLNHITTPHVFLWSAVAASSALPGIMKSSQLMARNNKGETVPFVSLGEKWMDGTLSDDLPMTSLSNVFQATNFIASQVNPPIVPFVSKNIGQASFFSRIKSVIMTDIQQRVGFLSFLDLIPKFYGQNVGNIARQVFVGKVTIVPDFNFFDSIGLSAIINPDEVSIKRFRKGGKQATYPKMAFIKHLCAIEKVLDKCLDELHGENSFNFYQNWLHPKNQDPLKAHKLSRKNSSQ